MPKAAALPPRPVSPSPHWVARSPFSVAELADGFGAGWPPPTRLRVPARRRDLLSRRADFARLRALRRRKYKGQPPRGSKQDDTARALNAVARCRGLPDSLTQNVKRRIPFTSTKRSALLAAPQSMRTVHRFT